MLEDNRYFLQSVLTVVGALLPIADVEATGGRASIRRRIAKPACITDSGRTILDCRHEAGLEIEQTRRERESASFECA